MGAGEGNKKGEILDGPAEGRESRERGSGGGGVRGSAQILDARHTTPHHTTTQQQRHTTQHTGDPTQGGLGQERSLAGRSMAQKTRHEQQIVPKSSLIGQGILGSRMIRKGLGTKRFVQKKPRGCWGLKWSEKKNMQKTNI